MIHCAIKRSKAARTKAFHTSRPQRKPFSSSTQAGNGSINATKAGVDVEKLLSKPIWSVAKLVLPNHQPVSTPQVSSKHLQHLLRLSALPPPRDEFEEANMLSVLSSQLHFVKEIQSVDTTGVEPLRSLRDETSAGEKDAELGLQAFKDALEMEEIRGRFHKRLRRKRSIQSITAEENWDVLGATGKKIGRYFVVEGEKGN